MPKFNDKMETMTFAENCIDMFLEYRDVHGYSDEKEARGRALVDIQEFVCLFDAKLICNEPDYNRGMGN